MNVLIVGKIRDKMGFVMVDHDVVKWWTEQGAKQYPDIHLVTQDELDEDGSLGTVDYELSWCWPEDEPQRIYTAIIEYPSRRIIYTKAKAVYGKWGRPWLTAFKRAIRFLDKWEKEKVKVEMPCAVPNYRVQGNESEAVN